MKLSRKLWNKYLQLSKAWQLKEATAILKAFENQLDIEYDQFISWLNVETLRIMDKNLNLNN